MDFVLIFLSDPYVQLSFGTRSATSQIIFKKLNPTWDQMLVLESVAIYGHYDQITENPPDILLEIFDYDPVVSWIISFSEPNNIDVTLHSSR